MINIRKNEDRGYFDHGWLKTHHTFSFGSYYDDRFLGFRDLRVINEDFVDGGEGFPFHGHKNMEILTYILSGALEHKDSMGNGSTIRPGDVQYMSAGTGVMHSEFNPSPQESVHLLQIWILPSKQGGEPLYDQKNFNVASQPNQLVLLASPDGADQSLKIRQDIRLSGSVLKKGSSIKIVPTSGYGWLQIARGELKLNGMALKAGDGAAISKEEKLEVEAASDSEFLWFDLK